ncbi:hypothetical protein EUA06_16335 [Nocardioides glacieisoli]|uniref:Uncharacterized protein n=1 Tax=Nocardioides glacieisoli TaxID=1168730 RepID=A0A4Q2RLF7_9ACTN|nr:hypothetical protein [Nocardioides glacieisoli]RYB89537.1 hypothetical protein EUA06_16335 [Nocardioides glacieisoli]
MRARTTIALALAMALTGCNGTVDGARPAPSGGAIDEPSVVEPTTDLLDWQDAGAPSGTQVRGPDWQGS